MKRHFMFDKLHAHPSGHIYFSGLIYCFVDLSTFMDALTFYKENVSAIFFLLYFSAFAKNIIVELVYEPQATELYSVLIHKKLQNRSYNYTIVI